MVPAAATQQPTLSPAHELTSLSLHLRLRLRLRPSLSPSPSLSLSLSLSLHIPTPRCDSCLGGQRPRRWRQRCASSLASRRLHRPRLRDPTPSAR